VYLCFTFFLLLSLPPIESEPWLFLFFYLQKEKTIGYSQLANPLGDQGDYLPLNPSDPISVCTSKACADNPDKCYRPTKMAPVFHPKEISGAVHTYPVSGVSINQEVGGTRSSSVVYKVDSDEVAGEEGEGEVGVVRVDRYVWQEDRKPLVVR